MLAAVLTAGATWPVFFGTFAEYTRTVLKGGPGFAVASALGGGIAAGAGLLLPPVCAGLVGATLVGLLQTGGLVTAKPLEPQLDRLNPLRTLQRLFSLRSLVELVKVVLKLGAVTVVVWGVLRSTLVHLPPIAPSPEGLIGWIGSSLYDVGLRGALVLTMIGAFDYLYQWFDYERSLRMTKQELKEDLRETEGDPLVRARQRRRQRELARARMLRDVARATVVVTNPVHLAVALRYAPREAPAPVVVAKGARRMAERIREIADRHRVPVVENAPLAQALYRSVPVGRMIPPALYYAVAEVLALLYRTRRLGGVLP